MRRLNLGCGATLREGWVNLDLEPRGMDLEWADTTQFVQRDVLRGLPFDDDSVDEAYSENFLEHLPQTECIWVMNELWRVMRPGALATHLVPLAGSVNAFQDPTHLSNWNVETFTYYTIGHRRNLYYGNKIAPWKVQVGPPNVNAVIQVLMVKP